MSEGTPEKGQDYDRHFQEMIDSPHGVKFISELGKFDTQRGDLYDRLLNLANGVDETIHEQEQALVSLRSVAEQLGGMLQAMFESGDSVDDIVESITEVMINDADERKSLLDDLLGEELIITFSREETSQALKQIIVTADSNEDAIERIVKTYHADLSADVSAFIERLIVGQDYTLHTHTEDQAESEQTFNIQKDFKDHVLDIGKIAAGVTVALALDKLIRRRS